MRNPAVLVRGGFVALATAICANALFLQPGQHPAPIFSTRQEAPELTAPVPEPVVEDLQSALRETGLYDGPVDGVPGPQTVAAIRSFEVAAGREPTGRVTPDLLAEVIRAGDGSAAAADPMQGLIDGADRLPEPDPEVAAVQSALSKAAYGPLRADGVFGPQTREAIVRFQQDQGLAVTGVVDEALLAELRSAGALEE